MCTEKGLEYVVYAPTGGKFTVDLTRATGFFKSNWYNPRTGKFNNHLDVDGGKIQTFTTPDSNDWVLHVKKM